MYELAGYICPVCYKVHSQVKERKIINYEMKIGLGFRVEQEVVDNEIIFPCKHIIKNGDIEDYRVWLDRDLWKVKSKVFKKMNEEEIKTWLLEHFLENYEVEIPKE